MATEKTSQAQKANADDEIDLIELAKTICAGRKTIIRFTLAGLIIGLVIAIFSPKEYTASTVMVPQTEDSNAGKLGGLSSLAAMAGFNTTSMESTSTLSPMLYPQIVNSAPFQLDLLQSEYNISGLSQPVSLLTYYSDIRKPALGDLIKKYTIGLPGVIIKAVKGKTETINTNRETIHRFIQLTEDQEKIRKRLTDQLSININEKEGFITISSYFNDPELAAQVTLKAQQLLQQYITEFKIEKASEKLHFIEDRYTERKDEFEKAQKNLANFRDRNKNMSSALALTEEERLQSEYELSYSVYSELAKQLEQAKIQVKEETPVFAVIQPVQVPIEKSKPNRPLILFIWIFLGATLGTCVIFGRYFFANLRHRWIANE